MAKFKSSVDQAQIYIETDIEKERTKIWQNYLRKKNRKNHKEYLQEQGEQVRLEFQTLALQSQQKTTQERIEELREAAQDLDSKTHNDHIEL